MSQSLAPHALVVSPRKCGTHLVREVVRELGYHLGGEIHTRSQDHAPLGRDQVWRVLQQVYAPDRLALIIQGQDPDQVRTDLELAVAALNEAWRQRLGVPGTGGTATPPAVRRLATELLGRATELRFDALPDRTCWIIHQLALDHTAPDVLRTWAEDGVPRLVLNVRDPRDALLSMVTFLADDRGAGIGAFADHHVYAGILRAASTLEERLTIALTDPQFPGSTSFADAAWMLRHPNVCTVRFEDLVGAQGHGSDERQLETVGRLMRFLGADGDPAPVAEKIFSRDSFTFRVGRSGRWREVFTPEHEALFEARHGRFLDLYGYR